MPSSVSKLRLNEWTDPLSLWNKRKRIEEEQLNLLQPIHRRWISSHVDAHDLFVKPLNHRCGDRLLPVHVSQLDAASSEYENCLDLKTGRLYMKSSANTSRRQCKATLPSTPILSFEERQVEDQEDSLDLGLHLGSNTSLHLVNNNNSNNNRRKSCNASPTHSTISFQEEVNGNEDFGPLYIKKGNNNSSQSSLLLGSPSSTSSSSSTSGLVTMGCPKCLIFLMVYEEDPFCPRCGTSSLLHL